MGQFKPMVKMETTEPSVILKLKKGGHVAMPKKAVKKMNGGAMGAMAAAPRVPAVAPAGRAPARPSLAERRRAMMAAKAMAAPVMAKKGGMPMKDGKPAFLSKKHGGKMESKAEHAKEATKAELKAHADKPASKAHKGLKTGGVVKGQGGYKTGGVVKGQGGFKKGGSVKKMADGGGAMQTSPAQLTPIMPRFLDNPQYPTNVASGGSAQSGLGMVDSGSKTIGDALSRAASAIGRKKGGAVKKFAKGGLIDDGRPEQMPQGKKKPSAPVSISRLAGTFKKGGAVKKAEGGYSSRGPTDQDKMIKLEKESITTNVDDSIPTPEEMKRLRETYDQQLKKEQKGSENFMKNLRLRKKGGCA